VFVSLRLGSVVASTLEVAPWLMVIGQHKGVVFPAVALLLVFNYWFAIIRPRNADCAPGEMCHIDRPTMRFNRKMFWASVVIYVVAVTATYSAIWWVRMQSWRRRCPPDTISSEVYR
jgi:hypothetical protein